MKSKAHRGAAKWQRAGGPAAAGGPIAGGAVTGLAAPLAWGANLWLIALGWPLLAEPSASRTALAAGSGIAALVVGAVCAQLGRAALAAGAWLVAFPVCVAFGFAARGEAALEPFALTVATASVWVFGATSARALGSGTRGEPLQLVALPNAARRTAAPRVLRRARLRAALAIVFGAGSLAIVTLAPTLGQAPELARAWGTSAPDASVLVAVVAAAIACGTTSVFLSAALRPLTAFERRPTSPMRAALGIALAIVSATTYYMLHTR